MLTNAQAETVAAYLLEVFPGSGRERQHSYTSAWQMASEALDALGYAEETTWGFVLHETPVKPTVLPRWDDVSVVVLLVAEQAGRVRLAGYHAPDVRTGPGTADELTLATIEELGLVADGRWTDAATEVLWRVAPDESGADFRADDRLNRVLKETVPKDVVEEIARVREIRSEVVMRNELEFLFFERWRIDEGWLEDETGGRALAVFHDPLAAEAAARFSGL
jgi:hypothetical protein